MKLYFIEVRVVTPVLLPVQAENSEEAQAYVRRTVRQYESLGYEVASAQLRRSSKGNPSKAMRPVKPLKASSGRMPLPSFACVEDEIYDEDDPER